jgi:hypothetical protein
MAQSVSKSLKENKDPNTETNDSQKSKTVKIPKPQKTLQKTLSESKQADKATPSSASKLNLPLDSQFICGDHIFQEHAQLIKNLQKMTEGFDLHSFVQGKIGQETSSGNVITGNTNILNRLTDVYKITAQRLVMDGHAKDLDSAYKILVGVLDLKIKGSPLKVAMFCEQLYFMPVTRMGRD